MNDPSSQIFAIVLAATWCGFGLYGVLRKIERSPQARELLERFRRARLSTKAAFVAGEKNAVAAAPPDWIFSRAWDTVRLTVRGTDERDEALSVRLDTDAGVLILR